MKTSEHTPLSASTKWEEYQLLEILDALDAQKCVLILGNYAFSKPVALRNTEADEFFLPEILQNEQKKWAEESPEDLSMDYFSIAQSLIQRAGGQRMFMALTDIKWEDLGEKQKERFRKISEIPFDLIISTYPFDLLDNVFTQNQIEHDFNYYSYAQNPSILKEPSASCPLIYNLFGNIRHKESMVISLDRLYQFFFGIAGVRGLPKVVEDKISQATHLVFMGFDFEAWYMKLLMRILKVHEKRNSYAHPHKPSVLAMNNRLFFEQNFKMTFLERRVDEFVDELHATCKTENMLRQKSQEADLSKYDKLHKMITQYELEEAMLIMDEILLADGKEGDLLSTLSVYRRTYHKIREWENYDSLSKQELEKKHQLLRANLLDFLEDMKAKINF